jgi:hypothetical protein
MDRITDVHIHIQPWDRLKPEVEKVMRRGKEEAYEFLLAVMKDPRMLIDLLDRARIWRVGIINYPSPDLMGFGDESNEFSARYAAHDRERILPYGGVHPRFTKDPEGDVDRLVELGIAALKIHPPHQLYPANAYTEGLEPLARIYGRASEHGLPVMIHTGTSVFPGARSKWGRPMEIDDVAIDFPDLRIVMAHGGRPLWMDEAFFVLRRHPNVWLDLSSIPPRRLLEYFPRLEEIVDRVVWGTDWPGPGVTDLRANLDRFLELPLSDGAKRKITVDNPLRLFPARA